jgi:ABC-2 type transport system ATP-binding protein
MTAISALHLTKRFGSVTAVDDVSITVEEGEIFGFLGPNGAGKTTTIRMLTGVLTPDTGTVTINGIDMHRNPLQAKMQMGVIPENSTVYSDLTPEQNLHLTGKFYGMSRDDRSRRVDELLPYLGLEQRRNDPVRTFSKGMRQRISIGCAIIHKPKVLLLDEPTEGLDVQSRRLVIETIRRMNKEGSTVLLTTHNIEEANTICGRVGIINKGKIVATGKPENLKKLFDTTQSVEVSFEQPVDPAVFSSPAILRIEAIGDKWRLYTDNPGAVVQYIGALAAARQLIITSIHTSGPSLEEAFVRITGGGA